MPVLLTLDRLDIYSPFESFNAGDIILLSMGMFLVLGFLLRPLRSVAADLGQ